MNRLIQALLLLSLSAPVLAAELAPFTTDGCSSFPDGTIEQHSLWGNCCIRHDLAYWKGGSYEERQQADQALEQCVAQLGEPYIARLMHAGVRVGGSPLLPTPFRWGYGWPFLRGYQTLSEGEKKQVHQRLEEFQLLVKSIDQEMKSLEQ